MTLRDLAEETRATSSKRVSGFLVLEKMTLGLSPLIFRLDRALDFSPPNGWHMVSQLRSTVALFDFLLPAPGSPSPSLFFQKMPNLLVFPELSDNWRCVIRVDRT